MVAARRATSSNQKTKDETSGKKASTTTNNNNKSPIISTALDENNNTSKKGSSVSVVSNKSSSSSSKMPVSTPIHGTSSQNNSGVGGEDSSSSSSINPKAPAVTPAPAAAATPPKKSASPTDSVLPNVTMPNSVLATPTHQRPPSRSGDSVLSSGGRTTTSRRGGRTRSRSPTSGHTLYGGGRPPSTTPSIPSEVGGAGSPANPSAAAAAAAAAAKSFRNPNPGAGAVAASAAAPPAGGGGMPPSMQYQQQQQPAYYGGSHPGGPSRRGGPPPGGGYGGYDPAGQGRGGPSSSVSVSSTSSSQQQQQQQYRSTGPPPPGYYDPRNGNPNPSAYHRGGGGRGGPPPPGSRGGYDGPIGPDGRPLSRNGVPFTGDAYGYHPYQQHAGGRGGPPPPPGSSRDRPPSSSYGGQQYPGASSGSSSSNGRSGYRSGPPQPPGTVDGSGPAGAGIDNGEQYGRQPLPPPYDQRSSSRGPPPSYSQYPPQYGGPPPSSSRGRGPPPPGSYPGHHYQYSHPSYRDQRDPGGRGPPPSYYRGHPSSHLGGGRPPSRGGPPPGHPDYLRQHYPPHLLPPPQYQEQQDKGSNPDVKSTRTLIGTATPLHLPRANDRNDKNSGQEQQQLQHPASHLPPPQQQQLQDRPPSTGPPHSQQHPAQLSHQHQQQQQQQLQRKNSSSSSRRGSAESVFRGKSSGNNTNNMDSSMKTKNGNDPKSILDSLQTPSTSFEERKSSKPLPGVTKDDPKDVRRQQNGLSPEGPPRLRNSSNGGDLSFDPQRSPKGSLQMGPPLLTNSLDMAPSFSLFNQSFDSLGDTAQFFNVGGPLDSSMLNSSTSFDVSNFKTSSPVNNSGDPTSLQLTTSNGTFKLNASMSGALFGMSPTNSFGNGPTPSFSANSAARGAITLLGGANDRSASPSQVLDILRSQSKGGAGDIDLKFSSSLCSPMIGTVGSYSGSRPFATGADSGPLQPSLIDRNLRGGNNEYYNKPSSRGGPSSERRNHLSPRPSQPQHYPSHASNYYSHGVGGSYHQPTILSHHNPQQSQYHRSHRLSSSNRGPYYHQYAPSKDGTTPFYVFLCKHKEAFRDVTFLLPQLKIALLAASPSGDKVKKENEDTPKRAGRYGRNADPTQDDSAVARRRIVSAVCAFGGTFTGSRMSNLAPDSSGNDSNSPVVSSLSNTNNKTNSIFREKKSDPVTVTPSSSGASASTAATRTSSSSTKFPAGTSRDQQHSSSKPISPEQARYDGALPTRYYESDNRLSWEFEENPPIGRLPSSSNHGKFWKKKADDKSKSPKKKRRTGVNGESIVASSKDNDDSKEENKNVIKDDENGDEKDSTDGGSPDSKEKTRYRCKLCGQPKTNHVCPYQQSMVRHIGAMVHPAVNAFTAAEPGRLATDLKEMNNLAISAAAVEAAKINATMNNSSNNTANSVENSPIRGLPTPDRSSSSSRTGTNPEGGSPTETATVAAATAAAQVTPETTARSGNGGGESASVDENDTGDGGPPSLVVGITSPVAASPSNLSTPQRGTPGNTSHAGTPAAMSSSGTPSSSSHLSKNHSHTPKRSHSRMMMSHGAAAAAGDQTDLLFVEEMELNPEQFRTVTPSKLVDDEENTAAFTYPALPLPYAQRKRLSDNLFSLSKEIPQLTDECASVLREARERDLWDLAVAELMTQVVVVVHCHDNDMQFEGLQRYLLTLGFSC